MGPTLPLAGEEPFSFTTALRPHFACDDLSQRPEFVRILGLGGKWTYDYENPYHPKLGMEGDDYVYFAGKPRYPREHITRAERGPDHTLTTPSWALGGLTSSVHESLPTVGGTMAGIAPACCGGKRIEKLYVHAHTSKASHARWMQYIPSDCTYGSSSLSHPGAPCRSNTNTLSSLSCLAGKRIDKLWVDAHTSDVKFCPGDATHMELLLRHGFEDVGAFNQGLLYEKDAEFANFVVLATGRVARKIT